MNHDDWLDVAEREYVRLLDLLRELAPAEWEADTDCAGWTVRDVVAHVTGAAQSTASIRESARQMLRARRHEGDQLVDRINEVQLADRRGTTPSDLIAELDGAARRSVRTRRRLPGLVRRIPVPTDTPGLGTTTLGFLNDTVYTRDVWMHRVDICRATGRHLTLTAEHDGRIVADAAQAWMQQPGSASGLVLTGPAGDEFGAVDEQSPAFDAVDFCRALSGRGTLTGVRSDLIPF
jgi:uncharacterized protein (TIGR03083 family)